jgi:hypothetical protein
MMLSLPNRLLTSTFDERCGVVSRLGNWGKLQADDDGAAGGCEHVIDLHVW